MKTVLSVAIICIIAVTSALAKDFHLPQIHYTEAERLVVTRVKAYYPIEARRRGITGSGVVRVTVDAAGTVTGASMAMSTGSAILDDAAASAFKRWRFKPGRAFFFRIPVTFSM